MTPTLQQVVLMCKFYTLLSATVFFLNKQVNNLKFKLQEIQNSNWIKYIFIALGEKTKNF